MRYAVQSGIIRYNPALDMAGALTTVKRQHRPALDLSRLPELLSHTKNKKRKESVMSEISRQEFQRRRQALVEQMQPAAPLW